MEATAEQKRAIETEGQALVVEAGAGTGKTWVLVQRFMHLLSQHPDWPLSSILAITFTEKATREMRSRIRRAVEEAAEDAAEGSLLSSRRMELEDLRVSTIHGLCATILRENAIAAGLDPQFSVVDEQEADLLKEEAIRQTLSNLADNDDPSLELLAVFQVWDLHGELESLLAKRGTAQELFADLPEKPALLARWREGLAALRAEVWQDQLAQNLLFEEARRVIPETVILDPSDGLAGAVRFAQEGCQSLKEDDLAGAIKSWRQIRRTGGRAANWGGAAGKEEIKQHLAALQNAEKAMTAAGADLEIGPEDEAAADWLQLWQRLWQATTDTYDRLKGEQHALDFDDLELRAEDLLYRLPRSRQLDDFIAGIQHLMVDEFQDTNQRQQRIVYALAHPQDGDRLFVVGDAKQSIYRFRQAQVAVFNRTADDVEQATGQRSTPLSLSFRTHSSLLEGLNDLFEKILRPLGERYQDFEARPGALHANRPTPEDQDGAPAPIELVVLPREDAEGEKVDAHEGRRWEARWLAERLKRLRESGFLVWDKSGQVYRRFDYGDAALLFRATTDFPLYEEAFKEAEIPYLTVSGRGYYDRPEVRDLIALLICLNDSRDDLNLAAALRSPLFSFSDETLYRLRWHSPDGGHLDEPRPLAKALMDPPENNQPESLAFAGHVLSELWPFAGRVDVWQLLRRALDLTGFEATMVFSDGAARGSGRRYSNIQKFLALARDRGEANLTDFLQRLRDLQVREAREGEALGGQPEGGAVQLMSIHAAKGLEFPVVVVADLGRSRRGRRGSSRLLFDPAFGIVCMGRDENGDWQKPPSYVWATWLDDRMEAAEDKRLLYVAFTRAADLLILSGREGQKNAWLQQLLSLWDIEPSGESEEIVSMENYSLKIFRPDVRPAEKPFLPVPLPSTPGPGAVPELVRPLEMGREGHVISATDWIEDLTEQRFALLRNKERSKHEKLGLIVHLALGNWSCLSKPEVELTRVLQRYARQEDLPEEDLEDLTSAARLMLDKVRGSDLFQKIDEATARYPELPFSFIFNGSTIHGRVDLLFRDTEGSWHLIDWKTGRIDREGVVLPLDKHLQKMAIYSAAFEQILGTPPETALCYLDPDLYYLRLTKPQLAEAREKILVGSKSAVVK